MGRAELGSQDYNSFGRLDGKPAGAMAVYLLPGANQLKASKRSTRPWTRAKALFPPDMDYKIVYDTTPAVEASIESIVHTFVEALILVTLVVFIFLQNVRATIIPLLTVPVSLIGTFIFFPMLGFSVNTLSMFGLVLAIGIVVDDAIVVVEAVIHHIEHGLDPREATIQAMKEVSGPVIGIALILSAVFVPVAFLGGLTGRMYQQFALTIAISVLLSAFSALSLSPALSRDAPEAAPQADAGAARDVLPGVQQGVRPGDQRLRRGDAAARPARRADDRARRGRGRRAPAASASRLPAGFIPDEDQGLLGVNVQLPPGASLERTSAVLTQVEQIVAKTEGVDAFTTIGGYRARHEHLPAELRDHLRCASSPGRSARRRRLHVQGDHGDACSRSSRRSPRRSSSRSTSRRSRASAPRPGFNFLLQDRSGTLDASSSSARRPASS